MAHLVFEDDGAVKRYSAFTATPSDVSLPSGVTVVSPVVRPDAVLYPGADKMAIVGQFSSNLVWSPSRQSLFKLGVAAPLAAPFLAAGAGTITGAAIVCYTFAEIRNSVLIAESNPSPSSGTVNLVAQGRTWSTLPVTFDARVTHLRFYVSMDGSEFEFAENVLIADVVSGGGTITEAVATAALGAQILRTRGVPPYFKYITIYHRRLWAVNGTTDTIYFSEFDEPESWPATNTLKTLDGRIVTCLRGLIDTIVVGTRASVQDIQGYTATDFEMRMISQRHGIVSHHGSKALGDRLWMMAQDGYYRFGGGGFEYLMPNLRTWFRDTYLANQSLFENAIAGVDVFEHIFKVQLTFQAYTLYLVAHYLPSESEAGGSTTPYWSFDHRTRLDTTLAALISEGLRERFYTGSADGLVRVENSTTNHDDDSDAYQNALTIAGRHLFMGDQSSDNTHGWTFEYLSLFVKSESNTWTASAYAGEDDAYSAAAPRWTQQIAASLQTKGAQTAVAKTSHSFKLNGCAGKGLTVKVFVSAPNNFKYRGLCLEFREGGENSRDKAA